jgi:ATP-binding cassette, subfamily B, bacterial
VKPQETVSTGEFLKVYRWVLTYIWPYRIPFGALLLCVIILASIQLSVPQAFRLLIDVILPQKNTSLFGWMMGGLAFLVLLLAMLEQVKNRLQRDLQERAARDLQLSAFAHSRQLGVAYFEGAKTGELLSLLCIDVQALHKFYREILPGFITNLTLLALSLILMVTIHPLLTLVCLLGNLLYYLIGPVVEKRRAVLTQLMQADRRALNQKTHESISALMELRAFGCEDWEIARFSEQNVKFNQIFVKAVFSGNILRSIREGLVQLGVLVLFVQAFLLVQSEGLQIGSFVAYTLYYFISIGALTQLISNVTEQRFVIYQAVPLFRFMQMQPQIQNAEDLLPQGEVRGEVEFDSVHFSYPARKDAVLTGLSLHIKPGERVALVGQSGCGKTTVTKLIARFYDPTAGIVKLDGKPLKELPLSTIHSAVGIVFQEPYLFGMSVYDNIRLGRPEATAEEVYAVAHAAGAHEFITKLPKGYHTPLGERAYKLSGGQKQRVALARVLLQMPPIVILDEATSALDNVTEQEVVEVLDRFLRNHTTIAVAHRLSTIRNYDRICYFADGRIAEEGSYDDLMARRGLFYRLAMEQTKGREVSSG